MKRLDKNKKYCKSAEMLIEEERYEILSLKFKFSALLIDFLQ